MFDSNFRIIPTIFSIFDIIFQFFFTKQILQIKLMSWYYTDVCEYIAAHGEKGLLSSLALEDKQLTIGLGTFYVSFENKKIKCTKQVVRDLKGPEKHEIVLSVFCEDKNFLHLFVKHVHETISNNTKYIISVYEFDPRMSQWKRSRMRSQRSISSVILSENVYDKFVSDLNEFSSQNTVDWYNKFNIPYKRSYLLEGPPGTGKSSLVVAMATEQNRDVCFLQIALKGMCDQMLQVALSDLPANAIVVIEDIDSIFDTISGKKEQICVTFSGLLNALDGISDPAGRIIIMTTNHMNTLDKSLLRPGRVDQIIHIGYANNDQIIRMFKRFYPDSTDEESDIFRKNIREKLSHEITTAELQKFFIKNRGISKNIALKGESIEYCTQEKKIESSYL